MRLIDADALINKLKRNSIFEKITDSRGMNTIEIIEEQPTVYDVEKVVAELVEFAFESMDKVTYDSENYYDGVSFAVRKAIKIVKRNSD